MSARKFRGVRMFLGLAMLAFMVPPLATLAASHVPQQYLDVVINEGAWMGSTEAYQDEWIELYNNSSSSIDLTGWTLNAANGKPSISLVGYIPAGGHFLLEQRSDDTTVRDVDADLIYYKGALENEGEDLVLRDLASIVVDRVDCSEGWFSGHEVGRVPMVRVNTKVDGSLESNWTYNPRCGSPTNSAEVSRTCTLTVTNVGHALDYAVYFNERFTATATTSKYTAIETALLDLIVNATTSVDIALYSLNRQSVVDVLIAAHRDKNVTVRVVGDDNEDAGGSKASYEKLRCAGITVVTDSSSNLQHNKFLIVDGQTVWTGSANFTDNGLTRNANNSIVITDTTLAGIYTAEFEEMCNGNFHKDKADNTAHILDYDGTALEIYFSPTDLVAFEVWDELASANESIHFAMFSWTDDMLANRVVECLGQGVEVYGVWDTHKAAKQRLAYEKLVNAGAQIKIKDFAGKVHHKFAVIDVEGSDPVVILGSYNWSDNGAYKNDENTLIIHDSALAQAYYDEWQRLWSAVGGVVCLPSTAMRSMSTPVISLK